MMGIKCETEALLYDRRIRFPSALNKEPRDDHRHHDVFSESKMSRGAGVPDLGTNVTKVFL